jgi:hypothetical protein
MRSPPLGGRRRVRRPVAAHVPCLSKEDRRLRILIPPPAGDNPTRRAYLPWVGRHASAVVRALREDLDAIEVADVLDVAAALAAAQVAAEHDRS